MSNNTKIETVEDAFEWFERNVARVPDDENKDGKAVHPEVRWAVCQALAVEHHFLSGSYGRKTQALKLKDIDIIVELHDEDGSLGASASDALEEVREAVSTCALVRRTTVSVRAVKAFLHDHEFHVDIVPALRPPWGDGLNLTRNIPDEGYNDWTLEYPEQQRKAAEDKNKETGGLYIPGARVIKAWNGRYSTVKPLRSYHAESLLHHSIGGATSLPEIVLAFFDHAYDALAPGQLTPTPGAPHGRWIDDRLSDEDRATAREKVEAARKKAHAAAELEEPTEAMEAWVKVFGQGFPAPSTRPDEVAEALRSASAFAVGGGLRAGQSAETRPLIQGRSWSRS